MHGHEVDLDTSSIDNFIDDSRIPVKQQVLDAFENFEKEYFTCIEENPIYAKFYYLDFYEKNYANKRFCSFCYIKKVSEYI